MSADWVTLAAYDLTPPIEVFALGDVSGINNRTRGVRTGAGEFIWRVYQTHADPGTILYEHRLLTWLNGQSLSFGVPAPLPARDGATLVRAGAAWHALFARLPGGEVNRRDPALAEGVGAALAELHAVLRAYPTERRPDLFGFDELTRVHPAVPAPHTLTPGQLGLPDTAPYADLLAWFRQELAQRQDFLDGAYRALPRQVIHGDYGPGNTLALGGRIAAVLDFDFAMPEARVLDVAQGLEFTMRIWENPAPLTMARAFCRGYARHGRLTAAEVAAVPPMIRLRAAVATLYWLGRAKQAGDVRPQLERITGLQELVRWLALHGQQLVEIVGQEMM
jgi:homoserine kinase type II